MLCAGGMDALEVRESGENRLAGYLIDTYHLPAWPATNQFTQAVHISLQEVRYYKMIFFVNLLVILLGIVLFLNGAYMLYSPKFGAM